MLRTKEQLRKACALAINEPTYGLFMERRENRLYAALFSSVEKIPMYLAQIADTQAEYLEVHVSKLIKSS